LADYLLERDPSTSDLLEDGLGGGGPDQRFGLVVGDAQVVLNAGDQVGDAGEAAASDVLVGELPEEPFDEVSQLDEVGVKCRWNRGPAAP
jgi:hypothetical protein